MTRGQGADVLVVGAGLAGLAAAYDLAGAGLNVTVLEAGAAPGGRMSSHAMAGMTMERGAQFLSTGYRTVPALIRDLGLTSRLCRTSSRTLVVDGHGTYTMDARNPLTLFTAGVLPVRQATAALASLRQARELASRLPPDDLAAWAEFDAIGADQWAADHLPAGLVDRVLVPAVHGFYFQTMAQNSAVLAAALTSMYGRGGSVVSLRGGLGALTAALAERVPVTYRTPVSEVRADDDQVVVSTPAGQLPAPVVIITAGAAATAAMLPAVEPVEAQLLATEYSPGLLIGYALDSPLRRSELGGAYGVLFPPESSGLAALAVASRTGTPAPRTAGRDLVTGMLAPDLAARLRDAHDDEVAAAGLRLLGEHLPGIQQRVIGTHVVRWDQAMPTTQAGRAALVRRYRTELPAHSRIVLAGDYLGFPWTDSAAYNGRWAAAHVRDASGALGLRH
ncbi:FAD-dependent oxidoreductase [Nonomuraea sp. NPDC049152]|uniref:protoporphyrinogen/coproporphyrinogen oxidase n=1 Tax=Nonomuraea sp. NPDC049152 TaxID=3154350 RepID=UPI0033E84C5F